VPPTPLIEAEGLQKSFGDTHAVRDVSLTVPAGSILGVLGPNGAGKTTTVRMLTTLSRPDAGRARVAGHDVVADPGAVRRRIGVTGQNATLDEALTGRENLEMVGQLGRANRAEARARAVQMLERFDLVDAADRVVKGYSGGMRRRLDLAASLVGRPTVLFLDEPTTGLDPTSRAGMWDIIRELVAEGTTVLLTTQYLDEADTLADRIVVIDHGTVIAEGTSRQLKAKVGGERLELVLSAPHPQVEAVLAPYASGPVTVEGTHVRMPVEPSPGLASTVVRALDAVGVTVDDVEIRRPSLDDVFFSLTGRPAEQADDDPATPTDTPDTDGANR
jgi:ABC-2 type transport system ATP-binding protein